MARSATDDRGPAAWNKCAEDANLPLNMTDARHFICITLTCSTKYVFLCARYITILENIVGNGTRPDALRVIRHRSRLVVIKHAGAALNAKRDRGAAAEKKIKTRPAGGDYTRYNELRHCKDEVKLNIASEGLRVRGGNDRAECWRGGCDGAGRGPSARARRRP